MRLDSLLAIVQDEPVFETGFLLAGDVDPADVRRQLSRWTMTHGGGSPGTLAYMAPEQIRGEPVTPATDLWALGAVFYEMLTGLRPFRGDYEQAVAYTILNESPVPLDEALRRISRLC